MYQVLVRVIRDTKGPDASGRMVPMAANTDQIVNLLDINYFRDHPDCFIVTNTDPGSMAFRWDADTGAYASVGKSQDYTPSLATFGDSWLTGNTEARKLTHQLYAHAGQPVYVKYEGAVGGATCAQILASIIAGLTVRGVYDVVMLNMGTNNLNQIQGTTLYTGTNQQKADACVANIVSTYKQAIAYAKQYVPKVLALGIGPFLASYGQPAEAKQVPLRVNALIEEYCIANDVCFLDTFSPMVDVNGVDGAVSRLYDAFHMSRNGAREFGRINATRLKEYLGIPVNRSTNVNSCGSFNSDVTSKHFGLNSMMYGNGGTLQNGATGVVPNNMTVRKFAGAGASTCAASIVPSNTPGGKGNAVRLSLGSLVAGEQWGIQCLGMVDPVSSVHFINQGDVFYQEGFVKTNGIAGIIEDLSIYMTYTVNGGLQNGTTVYKNAYGNIAGSTVMDGDIAGALYRTRDMTIPADATSITIVNFIVQIVPVAAGSCTIDFEKFAIVKR